MWIYAHQMLAMSIEPLGIVCPATTWLSVDRCGTPWYLYHGEIMRYHHKLYLVPSGTTGFQRNTSLISALR